MPSVVKEHVMTAISKGVERCDWSGIDKILIAGAATIP
jgi:hypothetical protein